MSKKIEVKVNMHCEKCKTQVLKAVTKVFGVDEVSVNLEKQMLIVIGDVDPVCVAARVRKTGKIAEIISVGPSKKPQPKPEPKPEPKPKPNPEPKPEPFKPCPYPCLKSCCANLYPKPSTDPCEIICPFSACYDTLPAFIGGYPQSYCNDGRLFFL